MRPRDRLRIANFTYAVQPRGGVVHALSLTEALADLGHEAVLFALDDTGGGLFRKARCPVVLVPVAKVAGEDLASYVRRRITAYVDAFEFAIMEGFDIYHAHDGISGNALATLAEGTAIGGYVRTVHHLDAFDDPEVAALQKRSIVAADRCYAVSALWQRALGERFGIEAALVPSGVDLERFVPVSEAEREALRTRLGLSGGPLFVSIGGIERRKNAIAALEAFADVRATDPTARLIVAGGASVLDHGSYRKAYESRAAELGVRLGRDAIVLGAVPDERIVALLQAADALLFPSLVEGFGLVLLEALACGVPAIVSYIEPFTEFFGPDDVVFVDPFDAAAIADGMRRALEPLVANALRARGPVVAARFTWEACAVVHVDRYRDLVVAKEAEHARNAVRGAVAG
jgi:glycosyltransferase-like protein